MLELWIAIIALTVIGGGTAGLWFWFVRRED